MRIAKFALVAALIAAPALTIAQPPAQAAQKPALAQRHFNQQRRIDNGFRKGQVNVRQTTRLDRQQRSIHRQAGAMRSRHDGRLTPRNRQVLNHRMNLASRRIYRAKHNGNG